MTPTTVTVPVPVTVERLALIIGNRHIVARLLLLRSKWSERPTIEH